MKYVILKIFFFGIFTLALYISCLSSMPNENNNYPHEQIIKKYGMPKYDFTRDIDGNYTGYEYEPYYSNYFSKEELENGTKVRILIWEKTPNDKLIIWLKDIKGQWIAFDSLKYNSANAQY